MRNIATTRYCHSHVGLYSPLQVMLCQQKLQPNKPSGGANPWSLVTEGCQRMREMLCLPQQSNAVRGRNMTRLAAGKLPGNSKGSLSKRGKIKPSLQREALNVESLRKSFYLFTSEFITPYFFCHFISSNAFLRSSLQKRFEIKQISKALVNGSDVDF